MDEIYGPIVDDVDGLAEQMHQLAAARYQVTKDQVGDPDQFDEIMYYTQKAQASVLVANIALIRSKAKIVEPLSEFLTASKDVDRASIGLKPKRLAAAEEEQQRSEDQRIRKEQDRKDRIAMQARERDEQLRQEKQQADANRDKTAMNSSPQGSAGQLADDQRSGDPSQPGLEPGFGPRFGPRFGPGGMSDARFGPDSRIGPQFGPPEGFGNRGNAASNQPRSGQAASERAATGHRTGNRSHHHDGRYQFGRHVEVTDRSSAGFPGRRSIEGQQRKADTSNRIQRPFG